MYHFDKNETEICLAWSAKLTYGAAVILGLVIFVIIGAHHNELSTNLSIQIFLVPLVMLFIYCITFSKKIIISSIDHSIRFCSFFLGRKINETTLLKSNIKEIKCVKTSSGRSARHRTATVSYTISAVTDTGSKTLDLGLVQEEAEMRCEYIKLYLGLK